MPEAHRDAKSAWLWFVTKGGIEAEGRDLPLVTMLRDRLNPEAFGLAEALSNVSVTAFVNTFFGVISPFVSMMRDLLDYFEAAGATEGPTNWVLVLGDDGEEVLEVDLDAFRRWINVAGPSRRGARTVPDLQSDELWDMRMCFYPTRKRDPSLGPGEVDYRQPEPRVKSTELTTWLDAYKKGEFPDLPEEVGEALADSGPVGDVAALLTEIYSAVRTIAGNREELRRKGRASGSDDFWGARGLWFFESDYWVRGRVLDLASYAQATEKQQARVVRKLSAHFKNHPRRRMKQDVDLNDVEQILSLPVWEKRYELYSAWILTLLLKALEGHAIELEHNKGRISFSFRETLMAHILTAAPLVAIYSERRVALAQPVGHGRLHGAQPDYSFWTEDGKCPLAVECKHYKRSSTRNFADALNDYSAALASAQVVLANYGPVSPAVLEAIEKDRRSRCRAVGNVNPAENKSLEKVRDIVRETIGEPRPLPSLPGLNRAIGNAKAKLLVVDISGSMRILMNSPSGPGRDALRNVVALTRVNEIATVDDALVAKGRIHQLTEILSEHGSGNTDLGPAVRDLLKTHKALFVLTDEDGAKTLAAVRSRSVAEFPVNGSAGNVQLVLVRK